VERESGVTGLGYLSGGKTRSEVQAARKLQLAGPVPCSVVSSGLRQALMMSSEMVGSPDVQRQIEKGH